MEHAEMKIADKNMGHISLLTLKLLLTVKLGELCKMISRKLLTILRSQVIMTGGKMLSYKIKLTVVMNAVRLQLRKAQLEHSDPKLKQQAKLRPLGTAMQHVLLKKQWHSTSGFGAHSVGIKGSFPGGKVPTA